MSVIMIVDDEPYIRDLWKRILEDEKNFEIVHCQNGQEACEYYQDNWQQVDLIVLDMQMPQVSGAEAYQRFVAVNSEVCCLVTTGYLFDEDTEKIFSGNNVSFLNKPFRPGEGLEAVLEAINKS